MLTKKLALILGGSVLLITLLIVIIISLTGNTTYTISFEQNGSNIYENLILSEKEELLLPTPEKEGYTFIEWYYLEGDEKVTVTDDFVLKKDINLTALWKINN